MYPSPMKKFLGYVGVLTAFTETEPENLGMMFNVDVGTKRTLIMTTGKPDVSPAVHTISFGYDTTPGGPPRATDDFSGLHFSLSYGVGGGDEVVEIDAGHGMFVSAPMTAYCFSVIYDAPVPTGSNPAPTAPRIKVFAVIGANSRPDNVSPVRTRRVTVPAASADSAAATVPNRSRELKIVGKQTTYKVKFYSDSLGSNELVEVNPTALVSVPIPFNAQSFTVSAAAAEDPVACVFSLSL